MSEANKKRLDKPEWLKKKVSLNNQNIARVNNLLLDLNLNTVCQNAKCPNIFECFSNKTATFLLLGKICTRNCAFCSIESGRPMPMDPNEPKNIASAIPVHINFSRSGGGERGGATSGRKCKIGFRKSSELPMEFSPSHSLYGVVSFLMKSLKKHHLCFFRICDPLFRRSEKGTNLSPLRQMVHSNRNSSRTLFCPGQKVGSSNKIKKHHWLFGKKSHETRLSRQDIP